MTEQPGEFSVSVVIPLFNKELSIERTICSILAQSRQPDELIIVDDGSTDRSAAAAQRALADAGERISWKLIAQQNSGVSVARNLGANESKSRFIAFIDADDEWLPGYLAEVEKLARAFPGAAVLTTRNATTIGDGPIHPEPSALPGDFFGVLERPLSLYRKGRGILHSSAVTVRQDAWERCGGFPPGVPGGEDMYLWLKLCMSETIAHSSSPLSVRHSEHSTLEFRKGLVPYQFAYFLGTAEGRRFLDNPDLRDFLGTTLAKQIVGRRLIGDRLAPARLRRLSSALPLRARLKCWLAWMLPLPLLRAGVELRRKIRKRTEARARGAR